MIYSVRYYRGLDVAKAGEIILLWHNSDTKEGLIEFMLNLDKPKPVVIDLTEMADDYVEDVIDTFAAEDFPKVTFLISSAQEQTMRELREAQLDYFFSDYATDWASLEKIVSAGVTQVYVTEYLGFDIKKVGAFCHEQGIKVRVFPNVAQLPADGENGFNSFFIRPDDEYMYEPYIDVYEFFGPNSKQGVLINIYSSHRWLGALDLLILNSNFVVTNTAIVPVCSAARLSCKHRCDKCSICEKVVDLSKSIDEHNGTIKIEYPREVIDHQKKLEELLGKPIENS